jgi:Zn-dependent protease
MPSTPSTEGSATLIAPHPTDTPPPERRRVWRILAGGFVAVGLLLFKLKGVLLFAGAKVKPFLANPFEGFGLAQFAVTAGTMVLSLVAYAVKMGVPFALGFIAILVIHEVGHAMTIRAKGLRAGAMVFIPFIGGAVTLRRQPRSAFVDAQIGLGGPIAGTFASAISLIVFNATSEPLWLALAFAGFILNLFNLTPVGPLDGGRIAGAITKWMWTGGALILLALLIRWKNPLLLPILLLGIWQIWHSIIEEKRKRFYNVTLAQRATIAVTYFSLVFILGYQSIATYRELMALQALQ